MRLCMFHPDGQPMERGWVGRVESDRVVHLAAQTLQAFFLGGGGAREHAQYPLDEVTLLAPVQFPPAVRVFASEHEFVFGNPAAVVGPDASVAAPAAEHLSVQARVAAVIGAGHEIGGYALLLEWLAPGLPAPKDRDFGLALGPVVVTPDETPAAPQVELVAGSAPASGVVAFDWPAARAWALQGTILRPGDLLVSPAACRLDGIAAGEGVLLREPVLGELRGVSSRPPVAA